MKILFIHQNFPGQYKHIAPALADMPGNEVLAIGEEGHLGRLRHPKVREIGYPEPRGAGEKTHLYVRRLETAVRRGQATARKCFDLQAKGYRPDVICCHPGWGDGLFLRDVWPDARLLYFCEFYYNSKGGDSGFDPEFPYEMNSRLATRIRNSHLLLSVETCDWGVAPTHWQHASFPKVFQDKISVVFDGVDTDVVKPDPEAVFELDGGRRLTRDDEVITFVNRNLEPYRGYHVFMRALPEILRRRPKAEVLIVGGRDVSYGPAAPEGKSYADIYWDEIKDQVDASRVHFLGRIPYPTFLKLIQVSSLHVYLTYPFVLSWSMIEAMSAGCLVLGSATPPVEEVIRDGENGLLFDFFDTRQLAMRVDEALSNLQRLQPLREAARRTVLERYDLRRICLPKQLELVRCLAEGRRPDEAPAPPRPAVSAV